MLTLHQRRNLFCHAKAGLRRVIVTCDHKPTSDFFTGWVNEHLWILIDSCEDIFIANWDRYWNESDQESIDQVACSIITDYFAVVCMQQVFSGKEQIGDLNVSLRFHPPLVWEPTEAREWVSPN
jgi:hypothetical protein